MAEIMTVESEVTPIRTILTSHSIDNLFDYCPRKFEFLTLHDVRPARESGFAAQVGTALHEGMQAWLIARASNELEEYATRVAFIALWKHYPWEMEADQTTSVRSFENVTLMMYEMIRHPFWDDWELMWVEGRGWAVEVPFLIRHTSIGIFDLKSRNEKAILGTQGKIDLIMRHRVSGKIKTVDIKTTMIHPDLVESEFTWSGQQIGYSSVAHAMAGIVEDELEVEYFVCCLSASEYPRIVPLTMPKGQDKIDDYWVSKLDRLYRIKYFAENDSFPRTNGGCNTWGQRCGMFDICPSRDAKLVKRWFEVIETEPQVGYDYWVTLEM